MLKLTLAAGGRLELPAHAVISVMKPCDGLNPASLMYDMGAGIQVDQLADQYGFVKKMANDASAFDNPVEVTIIERVTIGEGDQAVLGDSKGKMLISRGRIEGRRDVTGEGDIKARIFLRIGTVIEDGKATRPQIVTIAIAESLAEMDGEEVPAVLPVQVMDAIVPAKRRARNR